MIKFKHSCFFVLSVLFIGSSCGSMHYEVSSFSRTRLLVDNHYDANPDINAQQFMAEYKAQVDSITGPIVGEVAHDMTVGRPESDLSNLLADILIWGAQRYNESVDFSVYNMGGIRAALTRGKVTYGNVLDVAPFENKICFLTLSGEKVLQLFNEIAQTGGEGLSRGVELVLTKDHTLKSVMLNGKPIDPKASYRIATVDYLAQGNDKLEAFKAKTNVNAPSESSNNTRFIIIDYFKEQTALNKVVDAKVEGRIRIE